MRASFPPVTGIRWYERISPRPLLKGITSSFLLFSRTPRGPDALARQVFMCCCLWQPVNIGAGIAGLFVILLLQFTCIIIALLLSECPQMQSGQRIVLFSAGKYPVCGTVIGAPVVAVPAGGTTIKIGPVCATFGPFLSSRVATLCMAPSICGNP